MKKTAGGLIIMFSIFGLFGSAWANNGWLKIELKDIFSKETTKELSEIFKEDVSAQNVYDNAIALYNKGKYEEALAQFNKIITSDTRSGDAFYYRALTYQKLGIYDDAISDFNQAVKLDENNGKYYAAYALACKDRGNEGDTHWAVEYAKKACKLGYCDVLQGIEKEMAYELGSLELLQWNSKEAARYFSIALKENPNNEEAYEKRALAYYREKEYDKAVEDYTQIIKLKPKDTFAYYAREIFYEMLDKNSKAEEDLAYADNLAADKLEAGFNRASAFARIGEEKVARTLGDELVKNYSKEARAYYYRGVIYTDTGRRGYEQAMEDFTQAIALDPKYADAYNYRGFIHFKWREYDKAIEDYSKAINLDPDYWSYRNRGFNYQEIGQYDKALADYAQAIKLYPNYTDTYYDRVEIYEKTGEYEKAVQDYTHIIAHKPNDDKAYKNRAKNYEKTGDYANAMADYQKAVKLNSRQNNIYAEAVKNYEKLDPQKRAEYEQAFKKATTAVRKNPKDAIAYLARAEAYVNLGGNNWNISEDYKKAIALKPSFEAYYSRGVYNSDIRNAYYDAIRDFDQAIKINPKSAKTYYARGRLLFKNENSYFAYSSEGKPIDYRWNNAAADFTEVIKLEPSNADGYFSRAYAYVEWSRFVKRSERDEVLNKAIADYTEAIKLEPNYDSAYNNRALIYGKLEKYSNAIADFSEAIRIDSKETLYKANRANVYKETKEYEKAIADYSEAIELDPNDADLYDGRSKVYESAYLYTPAIKDAKTACELNPRDRCFQLAHLKNSVTEHELGKEAFINKDYKEAVRLYTIAIKKYRDDAEWIYMDRAEAYRALGDIKNAEKDEKSALVGTVEYSLPKSEKEKEIEVFSEIIDETGIAKAYNLRGLSYYKYKDYKNAVKDFSQAIKLDSEYVASYANRAFAYAALKDFKKAATDARKACELGKCDAQEALKMLDESNKAIKANPKDAKAYSNRAAAYIWLNDLKQATIEAKKACELGNCEALEGMKEKGLLDE
ncbi:MAG: tetratricopeptide repeat protein [Campylobacteraceae bacterium]|jgi:tetratricopeptide (TPR) repeat protein|nr:tetratricopeptide repeat protein [Campylobacteraceae bacterium]